MPKVLLAAVLATFSVGFFDDSAKPPEAPAPDGALDTSAAEEITAETPDVAPSSSDTSADLKTEVDRLKAELAEAQKSVEAEKEARLAAEKSAEEAETATETARKELSQAKMQATKAQARAKEWAEFVEKMAKKADARWTDAVEGKEEADIARQKAEEARKVAQVLAADAVAEAEVARELVESLKAEALVLEEAAVEAAEEIEALNERVRCLECRVRRQKCDCAEKD